MGRVLTHSIHVLWATPRTTSTAFEWMMRRRGDMTCFHEPFGLAWYQGSDARAPRLTAHSPRRMDVSFDTVLADLETAATRRPVFAKDMPQFTAHRWSDDFLTRFRHAFLIRDPAKIMTSLHRSYLKNGDTEGFTDLELGFAEQRELFDRIFRRDGTAPVVIDSDDLLEDPVAMVRKYCEAIDIPFIEEALSWEPGARPEVLWYDADDSVWHESLKYSDGLRPQPRTDTDIGGLPDHLRRQYDAFLPHYLHLRAHRLRLDRTGDG